MPQITYCCCEEAHLFDYPSGDIVYQTAPQATAAFCRSCFRLPFTILNSAAGSLYILPFATSYVFVYDDNYAGQTSIRVHRRAMDLRALLDNRGEGCPIAVLSSPRCPKACVKTRPTACPHSAYPAEKIRVRSGGGSDGENVIPPPRRTYRFCAEVMFAYRSHISAQKYRVRSRRTSLALTLFVRRRRAYQKCSPALPAANTSLVCFHGFYRCYQLAAYRSAGIFDFFLFFFRQRAYSCQYFQPIFTFVTLF